MPQILLDGDVLDDADVLEHIPPTPFYDYGDDRLIAAYLFGDEYEGGDPRRDWSGNDRHLVGVGPPPVSDYSVSLQGGIYYQAPFSPADIAAEEDPEEDPEDGGVTIIAVVRDSILTPSTPSTFFVSSNTTPAVLSIGLYATHGTTPRVGAFTKTPANGNVACLGDLSGADPHYTHGPELLAASFRLSEVRAYRGHANLPVSEIRRITGTYAPFNSMTSKFVVGANGAETGGVPNTAYALMFIRGFLSRDEIAERYGRLQSYVPEQGGPDL